MCSRVCDLDAVVSPYRVKHQLCTSRRRSSNLSDSESGRFVELGYTLGLLVPRLIPVHEVALLLASGDRLCHPECSAQMHLPRGAGCKVLQWYPPPLPHPPMLQSGFSPDCSSTYLRVAGPCNNTMASFITNANVAHTAKSLN